MTQGIIANVRGIANDKNGKALNIAVIELTNGKTILRGLNQFKTDLQNSSRLLGINLDTITSINHPAIQAEFPALRGGGKITGDYKEVKEGQEYEDNNTSSDTYGQMMTYKTTHMRVDGFLTLDVNPSYLQMELNASANAKYMAQLNGMFSVAPTEAGGSDDASDDIPEEMLAEITGGKETAKK